MVMLLVTSNLTTEVPPDLSEYNRCGSGPATINDTVCPGEDPSHLFGASSASTPQDWTYAGIFLLVAMFVGYLLFVVLTFFEIKTREQKKAGKEWGEKNNN